MSNAARAKAKILVAHQWKAQRGLYGADRVMLRILREMAPSAELIVVVESEGEFADAARKLGCRVETRDIGVLRRHRMNPTGAVGLGFAILRGAIWMWRLIRREKIQLVFTSTISVLAAAIAAGLARRPHIWFVQEILQGSSRALGPVAMILSDKVIAVSKASAISIHRDGAANPKMVVAYPGVDVRRFKMEDEAARPAISQNEVMIGHVARIHYWKGQDYFLEALRELKRRGVDRFRAIIVGEVYPGYERLREELRERVKDYGLEGRVEFLGHRDDADRIFMSIDIGVSPSTLPEPFGLVIVEAMAAGRPVIATAAGGPLEMIDDGVSGFLIPIGDVVVFADRLEELIRDRGLRERIGAAGRRRVEAEFASENFDRRVCEVIQSTLR